MENIGNNMIKVGCDKCEKFGILPKMSPPFIPFLMGKIPLPYVLTLSLLSETCPFCDGEIVSSMATKEDIKVYSKQGDKLAGMSIWPQYDLKHVMHEENFYEERKIK